MHEKPIFDLKLFAISIVKYLVEGAVVALLVLMVNKNQDIWDLVSVALTASAGFALLDLFSPSIGASFRAGAGLGLGANLVGFGFHL